MRNFWWISTNEATNLSWIIIVILSALDIICSPVVLWVALSSIIWLHTKGKWWRVLELRCIWIIKVNCKDLIDIITWISFFFVNWWESPLWIPTNFERMPWVVLGWIYLLIIDNRRNAIILYLLFNEMRWITHLKTKRRICWFINWLTVSLDSIYHGSQRVSQSQLLDFFSCLIVKRLVKKLSISRL